MREIKCINQNPTSLVREYMTGIHCPLYILINLEEQNSGE
jgi:hypothetical protein